MSQVGDYPTFTPVLTDMLLGTDNPGATEVTGNVLISALATLLQTLYDARYLGTQNIVYTTSNFSKTSDTSLANVTGLSFSVAAGGVYRFRTELYQTTGASGGSKVAIGGTCTATLIKYYVTTGATLCSALGTAVGSTAAIQITIIYGTITVANAGTLTVQFAQNASNATASTVYAGSTFECFKIG